jgi:hypothetical protein
VGRNDFSLFDIFYDVEGGDAGLDMVSYEAATSGITFDLSSIRMHESEDGASFVPGAASSTRGRIPDLFASSPATVSWLANNHGAGRRQQPYGESITIVGGTIGNPIAVVAETGARAQSDGCTLGQGKDVIFSSKQYTDIDEQAESFIAHLSSLSNKSALQTSGVLSEQFRLKRVLSKDFCGPA